ncbi:MAG TPA: DUF4239 domain-containing protein [Casimicrobiaceae bacterium]|nr:DUF4239 domain-containing protein [Casimicrobiaceae bacterium]
MSSITITAVAFACTFGGALLGLFLHRRLPEHHVTSESKDVIKLVMGLVATVAALVLGLLISSAHRSYDEQEAEVQQLAVHLFQLDRTLERFGPDAADARDRLYRIVSEEIASIATKDGTGLTTGKPLQAQQEVADLIDRIATLSPKTDAQRFSQSQALRLIATLGDVRLLLNEQSRGSLSWPFFIVLVFWLTMLFLGFGLLAKGNVTVTAALMLGAVSVAGAIFLILEMNRPYGGVMQVSIAPIRDALQNMRR